MKNPTVQSLRKNGYKIKIAHYRYITQNSHSALLIKSKYDKLGPMTEPNGGETHLSLTTPGGVTINHIVKRHWRDSYNKKIGVKIALGRIFKQISEEKRVNNLDPNCLESIALKAIREMSKEELDKHFPCDGHSYD